MPLSPGQLLNNRYRIARLIGQGGFGAVYRAWDTSLNQPYALKENLDTSAEAQKQFHREATLLAALRHANLPRVIDHFTIPGQGQYLVMDLIEGRSLADLAAGQMQPLKEADMLPWLDQICAALVYLHTQQPPIIHRDIKPENIIITPEGRAMLVDFGISKVLDPNVKTTAGARGVTSGFSPPEQYGTGGTAPHSDVYSLGATLYETFTGQRPPDAIDLTLGKTTVMPLAQLRPDLSQEMQHLITSAMELEPTARPKSAVEFRQIMKSAVTPLTLPAPLGGTSGAVAPQAQSQPPGNRQINTPAKPPQKQATPTGLEALFIAVGAVVLVALAVGLLMRFADLRTLPGISSSPTQTTSTEATVEASRAAEAMIQATRTDEASLGATQTAEAEIVATKTSEAAIEATQTSEAAVMQTPPGTNGDWQIWHDLATEYFSAARYDEMIDALTHAAVLDPQNTGWITSIGEQLHRQGKYMEAERSLRIVRTHNDTDNSAIFWLAWTLYEQKKYDDSRGHFALCIQRFESDPNNKGILARCYAGVGFIWKAVGDYENARLAFTVSLGYNANQADVSQTLSEIP